MHTLDFLVIGAQKAGTTTLHALLRQHPGLWLPPEKEAPYFIFADHWRNGLAPLWEWAFEDAPEAARWGKVTPWYMIGTQGGGTGEVARRVHATAPDVRLVAILREPVDRAMSHWRMSHTRGEKRTFDEVIEACLGDAETARVDPTDVNSYVSAGEYGRILSAWLDHFPADQLHVCFFDDFVADPRAAMAEIFPHLGVDAHDVEIGDPLNQSGSRLRVSSDDVVELMALLDDNVWSKDRPHTRRAFRFWFDRWNVEVDEERPVADAELLRALRAHFRDDLRLLTSLGHAPPAAWLTNPAS